MAAHGATARTGPTQPVQEPRAQARLRGLTTPARAHGPMATGRLVLVRPARGRVGPGHERMTLAGAARAGPMANARPTAPGSPIDDPTAPRDRPPTGPCLATRVSDRLGRSRVIDEPRHRRSGRAHRGGRRMGNVHPAAGDMEDLRPVAPGTDRLHPAGGPMGTSLSMRRRFTRGRHRWRRRSRSGRARNWSPAGGPSRRPLPPAAPRFVCSWSRSVGWPSRS